MSVKFQKPSKQITFALQSSRDAQKVDPTAELAEVWGRGRLTFDQKTEVENAQFEITLIMDPSTGKPKEHRAVSVPKMRRELLWQWLTDGKTNSNWADEDNNALDMRPTVINEYIDPADLEKLGDQLLAHFYPEYFGADDTAPGASADPNGDTSADASSEVSKSKHSHAVTKTSR